MTLPNGWAIHPANPAYMYELANPQRVAPVPAAVPPAPAPALVPMAAPAYGAAPAYAAPAADDWGSATLDPADAEAAIRQTMYGKRDSSAQVWLKLGDVKRVGEMSEMKIYLIPGLPKENNPKQISKPYALRCEHTIPSKYLDIEVKRDFQSVNCLNHDQGPKGCPLCALHEEAVRLGRGDEADRLKPSKKWAFACVNLNNLAEHYVQDKDASGNPMVDMYGQPLNKMVPGVLTVPNGVATDFFVKMRNRQRSAQHPEAGYPIVFSKAKTGPDRMNVKWSVDCLDPTPLPAEFRPVLLHRIDIEARFTEFNPKRVRDLAESVSRTMGLPLPAEGGPQAPANGGHHAPAHAPASHGYHAPQSAPAYPPPAPAYTAPAPVPMAPVPMAPPPPPHMPPPPAGFVPPHLPPGYAPPPAAPPAAAMAKPPAGMPAAPPPPPGMPDVDDEFEAGFSDSNEADDVPF